MKPIGWLIEGCMGKPKGRLDGGELKRLILERVGWRSDR
jgi:hypothetical protein